MANRTGLVDSPVEVRTVVLEKLLVPRSRVIAECLTMDIKSGSRICPTVFSHNVVPIQEYVIYFRSSHCLDRRILPKILRKRRQISVECPPTLYGKDRFEMEGTGSHSLCESDFLRRFLDGVGHKNVPPRKHFLLLSDFLASYGYARCSVRDLGLPKGRNFSVQLMIGPGHHNQNCLLSLVVQTAC